LEQAELVVRDPLHRAHHRRWAHGATAAAALVVGLLAASCGGSSSSSDTTTAATTSSTAAATTSTSAAPASTASSAATAPASPPTTGAAPAGDAFYTPPKPLPAGQPGDLIRQRPIAAPAGAQAWQILYRSTDATGQPIAVSGVVYSPTAPPPAGGRALVAWAHGTTGMGDQCAPSMDAAKQTGAEYVLAQAALGQGFAFTYTDYEGLGTPGVHTYVVGQSEGRTVLDSIRAARQVLHLPTTTKAIVWGHSQGGGAALFAAQLAPSYAPDADVVGAIAGAPAAELSTLGTDLANGPLKGYQLMAVAGFHAAYPDLPLASVLTPKGIAALPAIDGECSDEILNQAKDQPASTYFQPGAASVPAWQAAFALNSPGATATTVPIFIYQGDQDEIIPVQISATVAQKYCALGVKVDRKVYPGADHTSVVAAALGDILTYAQGRLAGEPPPTTC
jgi:pimeloyl-ACP methyl ester carboxylesterase